MKSFDRIYQGVDWSWFPDPFAFIRLHYDPARETVYLLDELYATNKTNEETAEWIIQKGYNADPVTCDSAEPKSISDYRARGIAAKPAVKGPGSIDYGMKWLQGRTIVIDRARTPHAYEEFVNYEYDRDRKPLLPDLNFNTPSGRTVARELLICYLNTGTASAPVWSPLGKRVEESSTELDWDSNTIRDILGSTYGTLRKPKISQTFEPCDLDGEDAAQLKIWNLAVREQDAQALSAQDMLIVHFYAGESATPFAERYASCMVEVTGLGGEGGGNVGMPVTVTYGGTRTVGTASRDASTGAVTFTPAA